jgi:hypothetical protein
MSKNFSVWPTALGTLESAWTLGTCQSRAGRDLRKTLISIFPLSTLLSESSGFTPAESCVVGDPGAPAQAKRIPAGAEVPYAPAQRPSAGRSDCGGHPTLGPTEIGAPGPASNSTLKRGRIRPWGRAGCIPVQPRACPCKAGAVSRRHFKGFRHFANVGGRKRSFRVVRARSRAPDNHRPRQAFGLAGLMRLGLPHMGSFKRRSLVSLAFVRLEGQSLISSQDSGDSISGASVVVTGV